MRVIVVAILLLLLGAFTYLALTSPHGIVK